MSRTLSGPAPAARPRRALARVSAAAWCLLSIAAFTPAVAQSDGGSAARSEPPADQGRPEPQVGQTAEITLKDGRRVSGVLVNRLADRVVLRIGEVETNFPLDIISDLRALPTVEEQYEQLRAALADEDVDGHLRLAEWVRSRGRLDLALWEVEHVLAVQPTNAQAKDMRTVIIEQERLNQVSGGPRAVAPAAASPAPGPPAAPKTAFPLLTPEQINLIRVYEVNLKDPPRMVVERVAMERFLEAYAGRNVEGRGVVPVTPEARELFYRQKPADVLGWMFDLRAREFYGEVKVLDNPRPFRLFRDNVHRTWIVNACATTRCHGGEEAGRLWLFNQRPSSDASVYTNFLILDRFVTSGGLKLINYRDPAESPLLQMGLPKEDAVLKHPEITGIGRPKWRPVFSGRTDERYKQAVEWIRAMYPQRTDYPVIYTPPSPPGAIPPGELPPPR